jgi:DNA replication protein DnaC
LGKLEKAFVRPELVILDELGFLPLERQAAELLFQLLSARHEQGSLMVTSNLDFKEWTRVFGDETLAAALLDRLTPTVPIFSPSPARAIGSSSPFPGWRLRPNWKRICPP